MRIFFLISIFLSQILFAEQVDISDDKLKKMIGHMLIIGFEDAVIDKDSKIIKQINEYELGGVILFDRFYNDRDKTKNISSPAQLQELTSSLKSLSKHPILISVDQEGGKVARLKPAYGFSEFSSAKDIAQGTQHDAMQTYLSMSKMLKKNGINCNFAPVVDLEVNPKNKVIAGLERSFGDDAQDVAMFARTLIYAQKEEGIVSVLKHFPGHGSSLGDSHLGFVNITDTWSEKELEPYKILIKEKSVDMIMTAHVFNKHLDEKYPATLSYNVNTKLLREKMGYKGVIVSDDLQMMAISKHYSLKESVTLAINSGVDILLFGNQLASQDTDKLIDTIFVQVKNKEIPLKRIIESNKRLRELHE